MKTKILKPFGYEISDIDLRSVTTDEFKIIQQYFAEAGLVFFRDQTFTEDDHLIFSRRFGRININKFFPAHSTEYPEIALVIKEPKQLFNIGNLWHTDHSYDERPALGSVLLARELPSSGGNTRFVSMYRVWDRLSHGLQKSLLSMDAIHSAKHVFGVWADYLYDIAHPVVIRHPLSGKKALYINPQFTIKMEDWNEDESKRMIDFLTEKATEESEICEFEWKEGSLAIWDNRAVWHSANNDYQGQRRIMHRVTIEGCHLTAARLKYNPLP